MSIEAIDQFTQRPIPEWEVDQITPEDLTRRKEPLPSRLKMWTDRGLRQISIDDYSIRDAYPLWGAFPECVAMISPDGGSDQKLLDYIAIERRTRHVPKDFEESGSLILKRDPKLQKLLRHVYDHIVDTFSEATKPLHPHIEESALRVAAYMLTSGTGPAFSPAHELLTKSSGSLSDRIPLLRKIAYEEGIYLDPLKDKMVEKLKEGELNPYGIAKKIEDAWNRRLQMPGVEEKPSEIIGNVDSPERWFLEETLYVISRLDDNGQYKRYFQSELFGFSGTIQFGSDNVVIGVPQKQDGYPMFQGARGAGAVLEIVDFLRSQS